MCGVGGGISFENDYFPSKITSKAFIDKMTYRGPDDEGQTFIDNGRCKIVFLHKRLSIIDLSELGHQPMFSCSGNSMIVFNGEIYNYQDLRKELKDYGLCFSSQSDTEVILNGYEYWGIEELLNRLDGMFAFALYDLRTEELRLARDRFGKKPLYYYHEKNKIAFSSDIRSFQELSNVSLTINNHALGYFFSELGTPEEDSIWNEVKKLKPAHYVKFGKDGLSKQKKYWSLDFSESCIMSRPEILENIERLLYNAVQKRLVADVPVAGLLSGGIDSSLLIKMMTKSNSRKAKSYHITFEEDGFDESKYAKKVAEYYGTEHSEIKISYSDLGDLNSIICEFGEPFADSSMVPTYFVSRAIRQNEKVVLGGDGGDEIFGGYYDNYFAHKLDLANSYRNISYFYPGVFSRSTHPKIKLAHDLLTQLKSPKHTLLNRRMCFSSEELKYLAPGHGLENSLNLEHEKIWSEYGEQSNKYGTNFRSAFLHTRLLNDYLVKVDRASMYASLEMRSPFLDKELTEFVATLPASQVFHKNTTKSITKDLLINDFGETFINRKKMGFGVPVGHWFKNELNEKFQEIVLGGRQTFVKMDYNFIEHLFNVHLKQPGHDHKIFALYSFHIWAQNQ